MTDGERARIREAFDLCSRASSTVKGGSSEHVHLVASAMCLGWLLDDPVCRNNFEILLRELRGLTEGRVTLEVPK